MTSLIKKTIIASLALSSSLILGAGVYLWYVQDKLIYQPNAFGRYPKENPSGWRNPSEMGLQYEDVSIKTVDGIELRGWFVKTRNYKQSPTVVFFHGNAGNIGFRLSFVNELIRLSHVNVLIMGYRGYSESTGRPSEKGLQIDSLAVMDYIFSRKDIDSNKIYILGTSLGGAVGIYATVHSKHELAGLILENTFTSMPDMVDLLIPKVSKLKGLILRNYWTSIKRISKVKSPILFISGLKDELIPPQHMNSLYQAATEALFKEQLTFNGGHNDTWMAGGDAYFLGVAKFIAKTELQRNKKLGL